jgi:hypothetical protein
MTKPGFPKVIGKVRKAFDSPLSYGLLPAPGGRVTRRSVAHMFVKGSRTSLCGKYGDEIFPPWVMAQPHPCKVCDAIARKQYPEAFTFLKRFFYASAG